LGDAVILGTGGGHGGTNRCFSNVFETHVRTYFIAYLILNDVEEW
jgi:hypothetical protein